MELALATTPPSVPSIPSIPATPEKSLALQSVTEKSLALQSVTEKSLALESVTGSPHRRLHRLLGQNMSGVLTRKTSEDTEECYDSVL